MWKCDLQVGVIGKLFDDLGIEFIAHNPVLFALGFVSSIAEQLGSPEWRIKWRSFSLRDVTTHLETIHSIGHVGRQQLKVAHRLVLFFLDSKFVQWASQFLFSKKRWKWVRNMILTHLTDFLYYLAIGNNCRQFQLFPFEILSDNVWGKPFFGIIVERKVFCIGRSHHWRDTKLNWKIRLNSVQ